MHPVCRLLPLLLCFGSDTRAATDDADKNGPQALIHAFYQAMSANKPDKAARLFSFAALQLDDNAQIEAMRTDLEQSFAEEFSMLASESPPIKILAITALADLPEELAGQADKCRAFKVNDSINGENGTQWSLCQEKDGWKIMLFFSTE